MGCNIHTWAEHQNNSGDWVFTPGINEAFKERNYAVFGWLAGVANYSVLPVLQEPRGIPADVCKEVRAELDWLGDDVHMSSWIEVDRLLAFNYDSRVEGPTR